MQTYFSRITLCLISPFLFIKCDDDVLVEDTNEMLSFERIQGTNGVNPDPVVLRTVRSRYKSGRQGNFWIFQGELDNSTDSIFIRIFIPEGASMIAEEHLINRSEENEIRIRTAELGDRFIERGRLEFTSVNRRIDLTFAGVLDNGLHSIRNGSFQNILLSTGDLPPTVTDPGFNNNLIGSVQANFRGTTLLWSEGEAVGRSSENTGRTNIECEDSRGILRFTLPYSSLQAMANANLVGVNIIGETGFVATLDFSVNGKETYSLDGQFSNSDNFIIQDIDLLGNTISFVFFIDLNLLVDFDITNKVETISGTGTSILVFN